MRILVVSDSHGRTSEIEKIIEAQPEAKHIFFLGDCVRDIEDLPYIYPDRVFHIVSGNCDYASFYKSTDIAVVCSKKILFTHGHPFYVKNGISALAKHAQDEKADLVLYGHTHTAKTEYANGIYFVNPGSVCSGRETGRSYAVVDIIEAGIIPIIIPIK